MGPAVRPRLGLYFDFRNPEPWRRDPTAYYGWHLDLIEEADRRGIGSIWVSEHHFVDDGYMPVPLTALAAAAARTKQARLGTAVVVAPLQHPMAIAEQAAVVDVISGGRLELGLGAGYVAPEFEAFGADLGRRYRDTDHALGEIGRIFADRRCTPGPVQLPVPLWAGYLGPQGAARAGRLGVGLLTHNRDSFAIYRDALEASGHGVEVARMGGVVDFLVADDPEEAFERIVPHRTHQLNSYRQQAALGTGRTPRRLTEDEVREGSGSGVVGAMQILTVDEAITRIAGICEGLPVEHLYLWASIGAMPEDLAERQMELLTGQVQPALLSV
ncbi:MAG: LLM class flavin-dependent oxidoreductase [Acidimicrobiaceae bacterium]|nr:LLM class flavin-dependent oxidoreductase [Acidimicrobiaceae bacterium]MYC41390.1 LLM class flavin-dependent oxidoreductase [Acidimicrobiaceae bacterium]